MNKHMTVTVAVSLVMIFLLIMPAFDNEKAMNAAFSEETVEVRERAEELNEAPTDKVNGWNADNAAGHIQTSEQKVIAKAEPAENGFRLSFEDGEESYVQTAAIDAYGDVAVHLTEREAAGKNYYDIVVVRPDRMEAQAYPLYSTNAVEQPFYQKVKIINERKALFLKRTVHEGMINYELAFFYLETGGHGTLPAFWSVPVGSEEAGEDFLASAHYAQDDDGRTTKVLLTSFLGKMWLADLDRGSIYGHGGQTFPAFGDLGSKPMRELIYPTPQLDRFIYNFTEKNQIHVSNHFMLADTLSGRVLKLFSVDDGMALSDPGPVWNREGTAFFLEYASKGNVMGEYYDNSNAVAAEEIVFFDRDGERIRTLKAESGKRINVYEWLDENRLLVETYKPSPISDLQWRKGAITYKEYDLRSGKLTTYRMAEHASGLNEHVVLPLRQKGTTFGSKAFVVLDQNRHQIWEPDLFGRTFLTSNGRLYIEARSGDINRIYEWDKNRRQLVMVSGESGMQTALGDWLVFAEREDDGFFYRNTKAEIPRREDGLAMLPAEIVRDDKAAGSLEWPSAETLEDRSIRATGKSKYGELQIIAEQGEKHFNRSYYGDYSVEFTHVSGEKTVLPRLEKLELEQSGKVADVQVFSFTGFDVLFYVPKQFVFSQGYDTGAERALAYAVTEHAEAFPLAFRYATNDGERKSDDITLFDQFPIQIRDNQLIFQGFAGDRLYEFAWTPDLEKKALTLMNWRDRTEEADGLKQIVVQYSDRLEQALGLTDVNFPEGPMDEGRLRELFADKAWNNPGFERLRSDFAESAKAGNPSRAFAWDPIHARYDEFGNIRVTFTINLFYAVGWAAHLDAILKMDGDYWTFHDFGHLQTEYNADLEDTDPMIMYNGLFIPDPLEL